MERAVLGAGALFIGGRMEVRQSFSVAPVRGASPADEALPEAIYPSPPKVSIAVPPRPAPLAAEIVTSASECNNIYICPSNQYIHGRPAAGPPGSDDHHNDRSATMEQQKVDMFIMTYSKYFEGYQLSQIRERLMNLDDSKFVMLQAANLKDPVITLVISIVGGSLGIDRFFIGDTGLGIAKLLTCGGLGVWTIVDWFLIMGRTREVNLQRLQQVLY